MNPNARLDAAIQRSCAHLLSTPLPDGGWQIAPVLAPAATALVFTVLEHLGHTRPQDAQKVRAWVLARQNADGSFPLNVGVPEASVTSTAACWAALRRSGLEADHPAVRRAWAYIESHGGLAEVGRRSLSDPYMTGPYLAFVGLLEPRHLPRLPLDWINVPGSLALAGTVINAGMLVGVLELATVFSYVKHGPASISPRERRIVLDAITGYQNRDGSVNGICLMTLIFLCACAAVGSGPGTAPYDRAVSSLDAARQEGEDELCWLIFGSDVWDTAMNLRALLLAGAPVDHPVVLGGVERLVGAQKQTLLAGRTTTAGPRTGGWAFQYGNDKCPDNDDTAIAMSALALWQHGASELPGVTELYDRVQDALDDGVDYLQGMQNADGGWSAYEHALPGKPRGPLYTRARVDWSRPRVALDELRRDFVELGDPATADITGRTLEMLAFLSYTKEAPEAARGIDFLERQQMEDGSWWGRWICNYLAGTAWAVKGLGALDVHEPQVIEPAVRFFLDHQNADGGWGESHASYGEPDLRGQGPSMPGLTGLVLGALCHVGYGTGPAAERAAAYLIDTQAEDGTWRDDQWQHIFLLPDYFYRLPASDTNQALEGLALHRRARLGQELHPGGATTESLAEVAGGLGDLGFPTAPLRDPAGGWLPAGLRAWRAAGDPSADAVAREIIAANGQEAVSRAFRSIVTNDDPFPPDLDPRLAHWLANHANLPDWADAELIAEGQAFYQRVGWSFAMCLFCASLPQAYAAADGARVLIGTQGLTDHAVGRVLETAQFLFDVLGPGAFAPEGRGLASARKVRLLHATVRQYTLLRAGWSVHAWGIPINQQDLAGTVLTFSIVVIEAMEALGIDVHPHEEEAWIHTWACIGYVMGVHPALLARTPAEARSLMAAIRDDQWAPSAHGRDLLEQLAAAMAGYLPVPRRWGKDVARLLVREIGGDRCADTLGIPAYRRRRVAARLALRAQARTARLLSRHREGHPARVSPLAWLSTRLMQELIDAQRLNKRASFRLPGALVHDWGLED